MIIYDEAGVNLNIFALAPYCIRAALRAFYIFVVVDVLGLTYRTIHLPSDAARVARNRRDACIETFGDDSRFEGDVRYLAWLKDKIEEYPEGFVLAFKGKRFVGHLELQVPYGKTLGYVNLFYLARSFRGTGNGKLLHAYAERYFRSWEAQRVELHVSPTNRRAVQFYQKLGYHAVRLEGTSAPLWRMELCLNAPAGQNAGDKSL